MSSHPRGNPNFPGIETSFDILNTELLAEKASALANMERRVVAALEALRAFDAGAGGTEARLDLLQAAAQDVWGFFIQRELAGFRDQREIIRFLAIPPEVLVRLGSVPPKSR